MKKWEGFAAVGASVEDFWNHVEVDLCCRKHYAWFTEDFCDIFMYESWFKVTGAKRQKFPLNANSKLNANVSSLNLHQFPFWPQFYHLSLLFTSLHHYPKTSSKAHKKFNLTKVSCSLHSITHETTERHIFSFKKSIQKPPLMIYDQTHKFSVIIECERNISFSEHESSGVKNVSWSLCIASSKIFLSQKKNSCDFHNYDY